jgi:flagellar basal body-associated protein FliL
MSDDEQKLIQDEDRSTRGGPQNGLAFIIIVAAAITIAIAAGIYLLFF